VTVISVSVVAAVAAVASYVHMHELATEAGEDWRAHLLPLSVDGMLVAASMVMLVRRRGGQSAGLLPWLGLMLGLVASLGANVAAANPTILGWVVSGWPPVALAVSFELLIIVTRDRHAPPGALAGDEQQPELDETWEEKRDRLLAEGLGRGRLARELGIEPHQARALIDQHKKEAAA